MYPNNIQKQNIKNIYLKITREEKSNRFILFCHNFLHFFILYTDRDFFSFSWGRLQDFVCFSFSNTIRIQKLLVFYPSIREYPWRKYERFLFLFFLCFSFSFCLDHFFATYFNNQETETPVILVATSNHNWNCFLRQLHRESVVHLFQY